MPQLGDDEDDGLRRRHSPFREKFFFALLRGELSSPSLTPFYFLGAISSPAGMEFAKVDTISTPPVGYFPKLAIASALVWRQHGRQTPLADLPLPLTGF